MGVSSHKLVQLRFRPLWLYVDKVREFCDFFAQATFEDRTLGERVGLIVHELVENAIRHGDEKDLEVRLEHTEGDVVISVTNTADPARVKQLQQLFERQNALSPQDAYSQALVTAATRPSDQSGLGLPRIRAEGNVRLELEVAPGRVCMTARGVA